MANEEVLGPRKTMFVLVIVVGCFAVLWPRILSPLVLGPSREQLKPNKFDREAGCCEVLFETDMAYLELINEVCSSSVQADGKLNPYAAAECRKAVNETCGVDLAAFLKRNENVGKTSKMLAETIKSSNSSCLKEHFGVPIWNLGVHFSQNSWTQQDTIKQERPLVRSTGPHPALRERGRAIPPGAPSTPTKNTVAMPPHVRPPPIPGMRPPLGSPGGPVPTPKSSMGFVMPIYTICIIVFFVYTLSKILFKRTGSTPYEPITPDPQFRRRVFRDDSRTTPDKLVVTAISGLVAEVQQQMEASYAQNQQRQDVQQDNHARPYTNGTILHNSGPVHIVASEYRESSKESLETAREKEPSPAPEKPEAVPEQTSEDKEPTPEPQQPTESVATDLETESTSDKPEEAQFAELKEEIEHTQLANEEKEPTPEKEPQLKEPSPEPKEPTPEKEIPTAKDDTQNEEEELEEEEVEEEIEIEESPERELSKEREVETTDDLIKLASDVKIERNGDVRHTEDFLKEEARALSDQKQEKQSTPELLEEAIKDEDDDQENGSVKHEAEQVQSIYLETEIPQQSRVLVADFAENRTDRPAPTKHSPMVVSGKMTLSLIQDAPRDTPERDPESTLDDFTTASAITQNAEKEDESDEEIEEEIEVEEIEEEVEEVEEEEEEEDEPEQKQKGQKEKKTE